MNAVIIGVGNQTKHRERFEGCRDFIQRELTEVGAALSGFSLVPPRMGEVLDQLREASRDGDLVLVLPAPDPAAAGAVTGAICQGLRLEQTVDPDLATQLARRAAQHERDWLREEIEAFAAAPAGCHRIPNPTGMVQGYAVTASRQLLLVLPAVRSELTACFESTVAGLLAEMGDGVTVRRTLRAVELGEAPVSALLEPLTQAENPRVVLYDNGGECVINITAAGRTLTETKRLCDGTVHQVSERLGPLLTSTKGEPLAQQVTRLFEKKHITLAVAEAGTDGVLAAAVKAGGGKDTVLTGGMNLLTDSQKAERLGVSRKLLAEYGGVSRRVAAAMAVLVRKAAKSRLGIAITCGDPDQSGRGQLAYIAFTDGRDVWAKKLSFPPGAPQEAIGNIACLQALNMLRLFVKRFPGLLPGGSPVEHAAPGLMTKMEQLSAVLSWRLAQAKGAVMGLFGATDDDQEENESNEEEAIEMNLLQRIIHKKLTKGDGVRLGILGVSLAVFVGCIIYIGTVYAESFKNKGLIKDLQSVYGDSSIRPEDVEGFPDSYLPKFAALYAQNPDIAGWIQIEDTKYINMPVVQYYDNVYYERRDFTGADNDHGVAFVDYRVAQREPSTNTIIYAHNMNDGQMFGELLNYKSVAYYREHPLVNYDSVYYEGTWKIFAVVLCKKDDPDFLYHSFIDKKNDQDMVDFVTKIRERSILNTKVDVKTDDQLLTLSTCDYTFRGENNEREARFVVFARKVRDKESLEVDTAGATINPNPVMPEDYYKYLEKLKKEQEEELKKQQEAAAAAAASKWLTEEERQTLSPEEAQKLAESREADAQEYLSYDERESGELDLERMLYLIKHRKAEFKLFLDKDEQKYSLSKRLSLAEERRVLAEAAGLTESEIEEAGSWDAIRELIESSGSSALDNYINENRLYLTSADRSVGSLAALEALRNQRRDEMRLKADQLGLNLNDYTTYEQFQEAVKAAESGTTSSSSSSSISPEEAERLKFLNDEANAKWISDSEASLADLKRQVQSNKDAYNDALRAAEKASSDIKYQLEQAFSKAKSWSDVKKAIDSAYTAIEKASSSSSGGSSSSSPSSSSPSSSSPSSEPESSEPESSEPESSEPESSEPESSEPESSEPESSEPESSESEGDETESSEPGNTTPTTPDSPEAANQNRSSAQGSSSDRTFPM